MAGRRRKAKGKGKRQANGLGSLGYCFEGLGREREECFCIAGTLPASPHLVLTLSRGVDTVINMASRWGNQGWQSRRRLPKVTWLVSVRTGIPELVPRSVPHLGHLTSSPLDGWQRRSSDGGLCPSARAISLQSPCLSSLQARAPQLTRQSLPSLTLPGPPRKGLVTRVPARP